MYLPVEDYSEHLVAAGFTLLLLAAQILQFKLIWRPAPARPAPIEVEMPDDLARYFAPAANGMVREVV